MLVSTHGLVAREPDELPAPVGVDCDIVRLLRAGDWAERPPGRRSSGPPARTSGAARRQAIGPRAEDRSEQSERMVPAGLEELPRQARPTNAAFPQPLPVRRRQRPPGSNRVPNPARLVGVRAPRGARETRRSSGGRSASAGSRANAGRAPRDGRPWRTRPRSARARSAGPPRRARRGTGRAAMPPWRGSN